jgi:lysophospholipase L1-like esterase
MTRRHRIGIRLLGLLLLGAFALTNLPGLADGKEDKKNTAIIPAKKNEGRHKGFVALAKKGNIDVVFFGDSITDGWRGRGGKDVWKEYFEPLKAANFGISGDRTQHVLWRIQNGELEGIEPKVAVLMIGTNNLGANTNEEIAEGVKTIVEEIHKQRPKTKVLLLGIFPRNQDASNAARGRIKEINQTISKLGKEMYVKYLDIGKKFLEKDGSLSKDIMPDFLHLSKKGYEIWAKAVEPTVKEMMKSKN